MKLYRKIMVLTIVGLFIGAGVLPICNADMNTPTTPVMNEKQVYKSNKNIISSQFSYESIIEYGITTVEKSGNEKIKSTSGILNNDDIIDQEQTKLDRGCRLCGLWKYAQGFVPTIGTLTRVELLLYKRGEVNELKVSIRDELDGVDLTSVLKSPYEISTGSYDWTEFDFDDIGVETGKIYYIVMSTTGGDNEENFYVFGAALNDAYPDGDAWQTRVNGDWFEIDHPEYGFPKFDFCFKTYGIENFSPNTPICSYDSNSDELVITATDPDGDQVRYGISWDNDNIVDQWTDLVDSGTEQRLDCGGREGTVGVIAEDEHGIQSDWVSQKSKNKVIQSPFLQFPENLLQNHPHLFPLLRQLLGL